MDSDEEQLAAFRAKGVLSPKDFREITTLVALRREILADECMEATSIKDNKSAVDYLAGRRDYFRGLGERLYWARVISYTDLEKLSDAHNTET